MRAYVYVEDLNVIMDYNLDTTSFKRNKKAITKLVKNAWKEMDFFHVWRDLHPLWRDLERLTCSIVASFT